MIAEKARTWAESYSHVTIIEDTWQNALSQLGIYDCIFFDDYPLESEEHMQNMQQQVQKSFSLLQEGEEMFSRVEKTLPFLKSQQYSKEDIQSFFQMLLQENSSHQNFRSKSEVQAIILESGSSRWQIDAIF